MGAEKAATAADEAAQYRAAENAAAPMPLAGKPLARVELRISRFALARLASFASLAAVTRFYERAVREFAKDAARGAIFLCFPVLLGAGAAFYFAFDREPGAVVLGLVITGLLFAGYAVRSSPAILLPLTAAFVFTLGVAAAKLETWRAATPMLGSEITTRITGRVIRIEDQASGRVRLTIDIVGTERPTLRHAPARVRLTARAVPAGLQPGDGVTGLARLMPPSGPVRPGGYDFAFASYFNGLGAIGFFMAGPDRAELTESPSSSAWLEPVRLALAERIRTHVGGSEGEIIVAMIVGFRSGIPEEANEWLRRAGLAHILAISGLHMALVAVTVMFMLRAGAALFPGFSSRVPVKKYAAAAALVLCTFYLFISGSAVAAERSYIMLAVMLAALLFDRAALSMRNVAIAALIIIMLSPHVVVGPSFQLSFAATAALIAGYAAWTEWRRTRRASSSPPSETLVRRIAHAALAFIAGLAATSLIAGTATALCGVWHFQRATPLALPANLVAMPLVSLVAMPSAVLAMLFMPLGLEGIFLKAMGHSIATVIGIARWFSDHTPIDAVGLMPLSALLALSFALMILVISTTWLRLAALPFLLAGAVFLFARDLPDILIAEDARLIGVRDSAGHIAVNRSRPNGFTMQDWTRALNAEQVLKPKNNKESPLEVLPHELGSGFVCGEELCLARHESGALVAHAANADAARSICEAAALVVLDDAVAQGVCEEEGTRVITKCDLALMGAAAVWFRKEASGLRPEIVFAIGEPSRPWHAHRVWSRPARGLPPYERK